MSAYRIVLMESHRILRQTLLGMIGEQPGLEVIGEMGHRDELFNILEGGEFVPNMVILDLFSPGLHGVEDLHRIKLGHPEAKVLVLSMHENQEYLHHALSNGAEGYVLKKEANTELFPAIAQIRKGGIYIPPALCGLLM